MGYSNGHTGQWRVVRQWQVLHIKVEVEESSPGDVDGVGHSPPERGGQDYEQGDSLIPPSFTTTATAVATVNLALSCVVVVGTTRHGSTWHVGCSLRRRGPGASTEALTYIPYLTISPRSWCPVHDQLVTYQGHASMMCLFNIKPGVVISSQNTSCLGILP